MKNIADLATGFYERVNGEGELGDVLSDDFQFDIMRGFPFGGLQDGLEASKAFFEKLGPLFGCVAAESGFHGCGQTIANKQHCHVNQALARRLLTLMSLAMDGLCFPGKSAYAASAMDWPGFLAAYASWFG